MGIEPFRSVPIILNVDPAIAGEAGCYSKTFGLTVK